MQPEQGQLPLALNTTAMVPGDGGLAPGNAFPTGNFFSREAANNCDDEMEWREVVVVAGTCNGRERESGAYIYIYMVEVHSATGLLTGLQPRPIAKVSSRPLTVSPSQNVPAILPGDRVDVSRSQGSGAQA